LWRVTDPSGHVVGHVQAGCEAQGTRFHARRFHAASRAFLDVGAFWTVEEAVDCLRYLR